MYYKKKWIKFKKWCYKYYRWLAAIMLIILLIISLYNNIEVNTSQSGGAVAAAAPLLMRAGTKLGSMGSKIKSGVTPSTVSDASSTQAGKTLLNPSQIADKSTPSSMISKEGPQIDIKDYADKERFSEKSKALIRGGRKAATENLGRLSGAAMDKFRQSSQLIYEVLYQIAFVIIILLIVFPMASLFIIAIICFILLRSKLTAIKSL